MSYVPVNRLDDQPDPDDAVKAVVAAAAAAAVVSAACVFQPDQAPVLNLMVDVVALVVTFSKK